MTSSPVRKFDDPSLAERAVRIVRVLDDAVVWRPKAAGRGTLVATSGGA